MNGSQSVRLEISDRVARPGQYSGNARERGFLSSIMRCLWVASREGLEQPALLAALWAVLERACGWFGVACARAPFVAVHVLAVRGYSRRRFEAARVCGVWVLLAHGPLTPLSSKLVLCLFINMASARPEVETSQEIKTTHLMDPSDLRLKRVKRETRLT